MTTPFNRADNVLLVTSAHTCLPLAPHAVWQLLEPLTEQWWNRRVIVSAPPHLLVHAVGADTAHDPDGWLTWTVDELAPNTARLRVSLSELNTGAPPPELDQLLRRVAAFSTGPATEDNIPTRKDPS